MLRVFLLPLLMSVATAASADDRDKESLTMIGLANTSCGAFVDAMEGERKARPPMQTPMASIARNTVGTWILLTVS
jgi:hypothetical protein